MRLDMLSISALALPRAFFDRPGNTYRGYFRSMGDFSRRTPASGGDVSPEPGRRSSRETGIGTDDSSDGAHLHEQLAGINKMLSRAARGGLNSE